MLGFFKKTFGRFYEAITSRLASLFSRSVVDKDLLSELERILIEADVGVGLTRTIMARLEEDVRAGKIVQGADLKGALAQLLQAMAAQKVYREDARVILLVGINGSGKTTVAGKLAHRFVGQGDPVIIAAADTFRAAAPEQLAVWADRAGATLVAGKEGQDPASVVFAATEHFKQIPGARLIVDTAGRLQTKVNLMRELEKIGRIIKKQLPDIRTVALLTVDAMLGQNSFDQARLFHESTHLDGIILTKCDGTGKGGIVFSIADTLKVPIAYLSYGERMDQLTPFDPKDFVEHLLNS
ncbi:MAG: signal recognition particle-docking protein FtsY [Candidatus Babeliaceae bacterium]|nr:signal recognition particle-docking protein FtsY [Candidatus Babeliaceae bacterium]